MYSVDSSSHLEAHVLLLICRIHLESLIFGNFTTTQARALIDIVENSLVSNMKSKAVPRSVQTRIRREVQLPDG